MNKSHFQITKNSVTFNLWYQLFTNESTLRLKDIADFWKSRLMFITISVWIWEMKSLSNLCGNFLTLSFAQMLKFSTLEWLYTSGKSTSQHNKLKQNFVLIGNIKRIKPNERSCENVLQEFLSKLLKSRLESRSFGRCQDSSIVLCFIM